MPSPGFFEIYPKAQPALPAGAYLLAADHDLTAVPPHNATGTLTVDGSDFTFKIISPRFTMPPDQILSTFPPASAVGDWRERLPQIVFKRRTLPWERNPDPLQPFGPSTPPWLALVVLAEGEGTLSGDVPVAQCVTSPVVLAGDADTATGRYLDVRESIVKKIFPTIEDLPLLCHVRKVDLSDTELALGDDDGYLAVVMANRLPQPGPPKDPGGDLTSVRYTAYVVNLEGQLPALPTKEESESDFDFVVSMPELFEIELFMEPPDEPIDVIVMQGLPVQGLGGKALGAGSGSGVSQHYATAYGVEAASSAYAVGPAKNTLITANDAGPVKKWVSGTSLGELAEVGDRIILPLEKHFRFPVLLSWEFVCTGDGGFERLMNKLDSGMLGTLEEQIDPALRPEIAVTGHISLEHTTRRGEAAESWYRGPFVPQPTTRTAPAKDGSLPLAHTGDQLRRVVPDGHEDVGVAAAFEIGRLLALSKPGLIAAMLAWREELFGASRVHELGKGFFGDLVAGFDDAVFTGKRALEDLLAHELLVPYANAVPDKLGPRANAFAASRVPDVVAEVGTDVVLGGLGIDAGSVKEAVGQFGVAGLSTLPVAVAPWDSAPLSSSADAVGAMQASLLAHLDSLVMDTLQLGALSPKSGRRRRDALDRLLEQPRDDDELDLPEEAD